MMNAPRSVTVIQPSIRNHTKQTPEGVRKRRVAGYARVSTDLEEHLTSYEAQVDYYTRHIQEKSEWEFAGMYVDEYASIQVLLDWARGSSAGDFSGINQRCYPC